MACRGIWRLDRCRRDGPVMPATAAVLNFKKKRGIINRAYQTAPDNIVGKMTIWSLDEEIGARERQRSHLLLAFKVPA